MAFERLSIEEARVLLQEVECLRILENRWGLLISTGMPLFGDEEEELTITLVRNPGPTLFKELIRVTDMGQALGFLYARGFHVDQLPRRRYLQEILQAYDLQYERMEIFTYTPWDPQEVLNGIRRVTAGALSVASLFVLHRYEPYIFDATMHLRETLREWYQVHRELHDHATPVYDQDIPGKSLKHLSVDFAIASKNYPSTYPLGIKIAKPHHASFTPFFNFLLDFPGDRIGVVVAPELWPQRGRENLESLEKHGDWVRVDWETPDDNEKVRKILEDKTPLILQHLIGSSP